MNNRCKHTEHVSSDTGDSLSPDTVSDVSRITSPESRVPDQIPGPRPYRSLVPALILFIVLGAILYSRTLHLPWILDDTQNILENPLIRDLQFAASRIFDSRGVAMLSFALNYHFGGLDVAGFHVVNIALHVGSSWFVFLILRRIFQNNSWLSLVGGLIFLAHPLQTQAVNYIVQRMAGMCAFFMLAAVYFYIRSMGLGHGNREPRGRDSGLGTRDSGTDRPGFGTRDSETEKPGFGIRNSELVKAEAEPTDKEVKSERLDTVLAAASTSTNAESQISNHESRIPDPGSCESRITSPAFYLLSLLFCALALWTKQNAVVLPVLLLLVDRFFIDRAPGMWKRRLLYVLPFLLLTLVSAVKELKGHEVLLKQDGLAQYWSKANETSANQKVVEEQKVSLVKPPENLRLIYLVTEFSVLWLYIKLLFFPVGQVFDYGYPLASSLVTIPNAAALLGHLLLMAVAFRLRNRRPLLSVGIAWFYVSLAVESTIIPLDAAVEHRVYMAAFGFVLIVLDLLRSIPVRRAGTVAASAIVVTLMLLTWQRNALWADPIAFARDTIKEAPFNQRNYLTLATAYADSGRWSDAERTLREAIRLRPDYPVPYENLGSALVLQGRPREALAFYQIALNLSPDNATTLYNAGTVLVRLGNLNGAREVILRLQPLNASLAGQLAAYVAGAEGNIAKTN